MVIDARSKATLDAFERLQVMKIRQYLLLAEVQDAS